jgi:hypothetical protein
MIVTDCVNPTQVEETDYMAYLDGHQRPGFLEHLGICPYCQDEVEAYASTALILTDGLNLIQAPERANCPDTLSLAEYAWGFASPKAIKQVKAHLAKCIYCQQEYQQQQTWASEAAEASKKVGEPTSWLKRIVGVLQDSTQPRSGMALGLRGNDQDFPVTYQAEGIAVSVTVQNASVQRYDLQVMGLVFTEDQNEPLNPEGGEARLMQGNQILARDTLDDMGNFFFEEVKPVDFDLEIQLQDRIVLIPSLYKSAS